MADQQQIATNSYRRRIGDMSMERIIRFQVMVHCYLYDINLTDAEQECLVVLGTEGGSCDLRAFCKLLVQKGIFTSVESARNILDHIHTKKLMIKEGGYRKKVKLNPEMGIQTNGVVMVDIQLSNFYHDTKKSD